MTDGADRVQHMDKYLDVYYANVAATIRAFGCDPDVLFSRADLDDQLREHAFYGVINAVLFIPTMVCDRCDILDLSAMAQSAADADADAKATHFIGLNDRTEAVYRRRLLEVLDDAERYGWLDAFKQFEEK